MRRSAALLLLSGLGLAPRSADALPTGRRAELAVADGCLSAQQAELRRLVGIELAAAIVPSGSVASPDLRISIACTARSRFHVEVTDAAGTTLARDLDVGDARPDVTPRMIALALADFVAIGWPVQDDGPAAGAPPPVVTTGDAAPALPPADEWHIDALGSVRYLPSDGLGAVMGGGARVEWTRRWLAASFDVIGESAEAAVTGGGARFTAISVAPQLAVVSRGRWWRSGAGAGLRTGLGRWQGEPGSDALVRGRSFDRAWAAPIAHAETGVGQRWTFTARIEAGAILAPIVGRGFDDRARFGGPFVSLQLSGGVRW